MKNMLKVSLIALLLSVGANAMADGHDDDRTILKVSNFPANAGWSKAWYGTMSDLLDNDDDVIGQALDFNEVPVPFFRPGFVDATGTVTQHFNPGEEGAWMIVQVNEQAGAIIGTCLVHMPEGQTTVVDFNGSSCYQGLTSWDLVNAGPGEEASVAVATFGIEIRDFTSVVDGGTETVTF